MSRGWLDLATSASMADHFSTSDVTSRARSSAVTPSAAVRMMMPWSGGLHVVDDLAQSTALAVGQALGDPDRRRVGHQHGEASRQRHLLGEPRALGADRVLRDLADDRLAGLDHLLDALVVGRRALDVLGVKGDVARVEHRVLRDPDVDEGQLHARAARSGSARRRCCRRSGWSRRPPWRPCTRPSPALERGDVGRVARRVHAHEVAALGASAPLAALRRRRPPASRRPPSGADASTGRVDGRDGAGPLAAVRFGLHGLDARRPRRSRRVPDRRADGGAAASPGRGRARSAGGARRRDAGRVSPICGAGRVSPILGLER